MNDDFIVAHIQKKIGGNPHKCDCKCKTTPINIHVHENNGEHIRWSGNNKQWMNKSNFKRALKYTYVCLGTNTLHHCTENCRLDPIPNDDHILVCPISGVQWNNETEVVRSWKLTSKCVPTITSDKRDPNMYSRNVHGVVQPNTLNIKEESCKREVKKILKLLVSSEQRKHHELEKFKVGRQAALKHVNRYIKFCKKTEIVNICTVLNIYTTECFNRPNFLRIIHLYSEKIEKITQKIYPSIMNLWNMVNVPRQFNIDIFIPAVLYIMQRGVRVQNFQIIEKIPEFDIILPDANTLDDFNIVKSTFTQTKNSIRMCIRHLLQKCTPYELQQRLK